MKKSLAANNTSALPRPDYGNWVSKKFILVPGILGLVFLGLSLLWPLFVLLAVFFLCIGAYFVYAWNRFSSAGGNVQGQIWDLLVAHLDWDGNGKALDIGCGNAAVTIRLAQKYPQACITGIDYWGKDWGYSKEVCEQNAAVEGVANRIVFEKASASVLPFEDGFFDAAVSNLVFHEVFEIKDKRELLREALRVVKKGGRFAFQDLFVEERLYGKTEELLDLMRSWGVTRVSFIKTYDEPFIPDPLKLPFMVGRIGILYGEK